MKKKILAMLLAAVLAVSLLPGTAFAAPDFFGDLGDNATWSFSNGTLTITGTGPMTFLVPWQIENYPIQFRDQIQTVKIGNGITSISLQVFSECTNLTDVTIPNSVTTIGRYAFKDCKSLTSLTIPDSVTSIEYGAFAGCNSLTSLTIPDSVTSIGAGAFGGCSGLTSVAIPDGVTTIGELTFAGCTGLTSLTIGSGVTSIGEMAFSECTSLTGINVESGNTAYCSVDGVLFNAEKTELVAYPAAKTDSSYSIPASVTSIERDAFYQCAGLTDVTIPNGVTAIEISTFFWCSSLKSVTIPASVTSIAGSAFGLCDSLTDVYYGGSEAQWKEIEICYYNSEGPHYTTVANGGLKHVGLEDVKVHYGSTATTPPEEPGTGSPTDTPSFTDVPDWCATEAGWAVQKGITNGTNESGTTFSPSRTCTDAEILTFLYRAAGEPPAAPSSLNVAGWCQAAVDWAYEQGMIGANFDPDAPCTRSSTVLYIWQARGSDKSGASGSKFTDVPANADYADAVSWAVANGITSGTNESGTTFSPTRTCMRGEIVTLLYRAYA